MYHGPAKIGIYQRDLSPADAMMRAVLTAINDFPPVVRSSLLQRTWEDFQERRRESQSCGASEGLRRYRFRLVVDNELGAADGLSHLCMKSILGIRARFGALKCSLTSSGLFTVLSGYSRKKAKATPIKEAPPQGKAVYLRAFFGLAGRITAAAARSMIFMFVAPNSCSTLVSLVFFRRFS